MSRRAAHIRRNGQIEHVDEAAASAMPSWEFFVRLAAVNGMAVPVTTVQPLLDAYDQALAEIARWHQMADQQTTRPGGPRSAPEDATS